VTPYSCPCEAICPPNIRPRRGQRLRFLPLPGENAFSKIYHIWNKNANRFPLEGIKEKARVGAENSSLEKLL
jgi:hypothetical protein